MGIVIRIIATALTAWFTWIIKEVAWASIWGFLGSASLFILTVLQIFYTYQQITGGK
jgi:hypothetical protein